MCRKIVWFFACAYVSKCSYAMELGKTATFEEVSFMQKGVSLQLLGIVVSMGIFGGLAVAWYLGILLVFCGLIMVFMKKN